MQLNAIMTLAGALIFIGVCGALCRRSLLAIALCLHVSFLGIVLFFAGSSSLHSSSQGISPIFILTLIFSLQIMLLCGVLVFAYRHRGTLNVDELRQLRG